MGLYIQRQRLCGPLASLSFVSAHLHFSAGGYKLRLWDCSCLVCVCVCVCVCRVTCTCMNQYVCMSEPVSFPLSSTSKGVNPLATDAGVCILSVGSTSGMHKGRGGIGWGVHFKIKALFIYLTRVCLCPDRTLLCFKHLSQLKCPCGHPKYVSVHFIVALFCLKSK